MYWTTFSASESSEEDESFEDLQVSFEEIVYLSDLEEEVMDKLSKVFLAFEHKPSWNTMKDWTRPLKIRGDVLSMFYDLVDMPTMERISKYMGYNLKYHSSDTKNTLYSNFSLDQIKVLFECAIRWNTIHNSYLKSDTFRDISFVDANMVCHFIKYMQKDHSLKFAPRLKH